MISHHSSLIQKSVKSRAELGSSSLWRSAALSCFFSLVLGEYHQLYFVLKRFVKCHFYLQLELYTWEWLSSSQLIFFKHFIMTYTPLCWLHPSCTTVYICLPYICAHTDTHRHARTAAHAGNICNLHLFVFALHIHVESFLQKTEQRVILAKHQGESPGRAR